MRLICALFLALSATATGESTAIFPGLRKRKLAAAQTAAKVAEPAEQAEEEDEQATQAAPGVVPAPLDVGSDGYPQLPSVSNMLSDASGTVKLVNSQASSLEARVVQAQMMSEAKMAKQKAAFDMKLKDQETTNLQVIQANDKITAEIKGLKSSNAALRKHSKEVEQSNNGMHAELHTLQGRLGVAKDFAATSLSSTDDSKNSLLQVLHGNSHRHHHALVEVASSSKRKSRDDDDDEEGDDESQDDDEDDDEEEDEGATSLLSLSSKVHRASSQDASASFEAAMSELDSAVPAMPTTVENPTDLLTVLSKDVAHLAQQEKESANNLKTMFIKDFRAGAKRHAALLAKQKGLNANRASLLALQAKLKTAEAHLESTHKQLEARLHGLGQYLQKLAHFAMAPQKEVPHLLEVLPKTVTVKAEAAKVI